MVINFIYKNYDIVFNKIWIFFYDNIIDGSMNNHVSIWDADFLW